MSIHLSFFIFVFKCVYCCQQCIGKHEFLFIYSFMYKEIKIILHIFPRCCVFDIFYIRLSLFLLYTKETIHLFYVVTAAFLRNFSCLSFLKRNFQFAHLFLKTVVLTIPDFTNHKSHHSLTISCGLLTMAAGGSSLRETSSVLLRQQLLATSSGEFFFFFFFEGLYF